MEKTLGFVLIEKLLPCNRDNIVSFALTLSKSGGLGLKLVNMVGLSYIRLKVCQSDNFASIMGLWFFRIDNIMRACSTPCTLGQVEEFDILSKYSKFHVFFSIYMIDLLTDRTISRIFSVLVRCSSGLIYLICLIEVAFFCTVIVTGNKYEVVVIIFSYL